MALEELDSADQLHIPHSDEIAWNSAALTEIRKALIAPQKLARLIQRDNSRWVSAVTVDLLVIVVAAGLAEYYFNPVTYLLALLVIAGRQAGIASIGLHEGAHRFLAKDSALNHRLGSIILHALTVPCIGIDIEGYRKGHHLTHHRYLLQDADPENEIFARFYAKNKTYTLLSFVGVSVLILSGLGYTIGVLRLIVVGSFAQKLVNLCLVAGVVAAVLLNIYVLQLVLLYWIIPIATWGLYANRIRAMAEHYPVNAYGDDFPFPQELRTRDVVPSLFDKLFVTGRNVNLHLSHHLFPAVPFYNLEELHQIISATDTYQKIAHQTHGYHRFIYEYLFQRPQTGSDPRGLMT